MCQSFEQLLILFMQPLQKKTIWKIKLTIVKKVFKVCANEKEKKFLMCLIADHCHLHYKIKLRKHLTSVILNMSLELNLREKAVIIGVYYFVFK